MPFPVSSSALFVLLAAATFLASKNLVLAFSTTTTTCNSIAHNPATAARIYDDSIISTRRISTFSLHMSSTATDKDLTTILQEETKEIQDCSKVFWETISRTFQKDKPIDAKEIVQVCDTIDELQVNEDLWTHKLFQLRKNTWEHRRYEWLAHLLTTDYDAYVATASFLSPSRIPRRQLPNIQDIPLDKSLPVSSKQYDLEGQRVVEDCQLDDVKFQDNLLDILLLKIFRNLVTKNTGGVTSQKPGIQGLVEQGRSFLLQPGQTPEAQHKMVRETLSGLMTPILPPFYRIFMSGILPFEKEDGSKTQLGPWFYAPFLTSVVTPTFFGFLVGPSHPNRRKDGQLGGLVVEKCKFLQESGCKGLCLHQCKLPAQQFFQDELGLALTVSPNFVTQECQWSFGETPMPPYQDPSFPQGCLAGCESRQQIAANGSKADVCN